MEDLCQIYQWKIGYVFGDYLLMTKIRDRFIVDINLSNSSFFVSEWGKEAETIHWHRHVGARKNARSQWAYCTMRHGRVDIFSCCANVERILRYGLYFYIRSKVGHDKELFWRFCWWNLAGGSYWLLQLRGDKKTWAVLVNFMGAPGDFFASSRAREFYETGISVESWRLNVYTNFDESILMVTVCLCMSTTLEKSWYFQFSQWESSTFWLFLKKEKLSRALENIWWCCG